MDEVLEVKKVEKRAFLQNLKSKFNLKDPHNAKRIVYWGGVAIVFVWLFWGIPLPTNITNRAPVSTKILDRNNKLIYEIYSTQRRTPIKVSDLPKHIPNATISIEDKDFYQHRGFSYSGIARAVYNILFRRNVQGGSTITQQLVKNVLLTQEQTIKRKVQEAVLTILVESFYSKDQILEDYLNQIPYGGTAYGIEAASELYFDKPAKDLTLGEASFISGLPQRPSYYSPFGSRPELGKNRQKEVLDSMVANKYINQEEADKAFAEELKFAKVQAPNAPHFALWIKDQLAEKYGLAVVEQGGLRVHTTLDLDLQNFAQDAVATEVGKLKAQHVGNGAVMVTRPGTGEILAMVGSKDYFSEDEDGKVNVIFADRQPGSSIKPLNYALAIKDEKITAASVIADVPTCFNVAGQASYCPVNYDGKFHGAIQTRFDLGNSFNIPAVRVLALNGLSNFIDFAKQMGITTFNDPRNYGLSLTLGGGEVRPYDMAEAYGVFANGGIREPLISILKVEDYKGKVLEEHKLNELSGDRVMSPGVTFIVSHMLHDNNARTEAFGPSSFLNVSGHPEVSVKTGTTNDRKDNWTIGYTSQIVVVTWVGNNDNSPMSGAVSGVSGASPIWNRIIKMALDKSEEGFYNKEDKGHAWPQQPENVVGAKICATDGLMPSGPEDNPGCPLRFEYFLEGTVPKITTGQRADILVFKDTHMMVNDPKTPPEQTTTENHPIVKDPLGTIYCLDCPTPQQNVIISYPLQ